MGIKVGDKVRVSKDAPKIYTPDWVDEMFNLVLKVTEVEDGNAMVVFAKRTLYKTVLTTIPCKYLVKVDAEAKEAKFKEGDRVRMKDGYYKEELCGCIGVIRKIDGCHIYVEIDSTIYPATIHSIEPYAEPTAPTIEAGSEEWVDKQVWNCKLKQHGVIKRIANGCAEVFTQYGEHKVWSLVDLFDEYDEPFGNWKSVQPKEPTEDEIIRQREAEFDEFRKEELDRVLHPEKYTTYEVTIDNVAMDWDAYTANLARDIAVKIVNKNMGSDPEKVGEYSVKVAKSVVEGLKRK